MRTKERVPFTPSLLIVVTTLACISDLHTFEDHLHLLQSNSTKPTAFSYCLRKYDAKETRLATP